MSWKSIETHGGLPASGAAESETLEFKATYPPNKGREIARDVAQFANSAGGTILLGVTEERSMLKSYVGVPDAHVLAQQVRDAAGANLRPVPSFDVRVIQRPRSEPVIAVNIPAAEGLVAVRNDEDKWQFPVRRGGGKQYLTFEEVEKRMLQQGDRRGRLLLERIPENERHKVVLDAELRGLPRQHWQVKVGGDEPFFEAISHDRTSVHIPYVFVEAVWQSGISEHTISLPVALTRLSDNVTIVVQRLRPGIVPPTPR